MPDHKKKTGNHNLKMKTAYLIFIVLLIIIIIFATLLLLSKKNNDDTVKGESAIHTETVTTALSSDLAETAPKTVFTNTTAFPVLPYVTSSHSVNATTVISSVQTTAPKNNISQNITVPPATSPRPAVIPEKPHNDSDNIPANTSENIVNEHSIKLTFYECTMQVGDEPKMPVVTMPDTIQDKSEKWESSDESIATVDNEGNITAVSSGICTVRVSSVSNPELYAEVKVTVRNIMPSEQIGRAHV